MAKWLRRTETVEALIALFERGRVWLVLGGLSSGGVFAWLAAATEWLNAYGPITWGIAGAFGVVIFVSVLAIWAKFALLVERRRHARLQTESFDPINPLNDDFRKMRINLSVFDSPFPGDVVANKKFDDCELIGPATVILIGGNLIIKNETTNCNFVRVRNDFHLYGVIAFKDCTIQECRLLNMTILVPLSQVGTFEQGFDRPIVWLDPMG